MWCAQMTRTFAGHISDTEFSNQVLSGLSSGDVLGPDKHRLLTPSTNLASSLYVWVAGMYGGCRRVTAGARPGHTFAEPGGTRRSREDTKAAPFEFRRGLREPEGHLRTRHRHGSGP